MDLDNCRGHIARFLQEHRRFDDSWTVECVAISPRLEDEDRAAVEAKGFLPQDLRDLTAGL